MVGELLRAGSKARVRIKPTVLVLTPVHFKISETKITVDPDKIFDEIFPSL